MKITQERIKNRKKIFKQGIDPDAARRRREDMSCQIRKNLRENKLNKRRCELSNLTKPNKPNEPSDLTKLNKLNLTKPTKPLDLTFIKNIYSNDPTKAYNAIKYIRKYSINNNTDQYILNILNSGVVPKLLNFLTYSKYPKHQFQAAWTLTNILSGSSHIVIPIIEKTPIISYMMELIKSQNIKVRDQAIWCISNIVGEDIKYRDNILKNGGLEKLLSLLDFEIGYEKRRITSIRNLIWTISNMIRGKDLPPFSLMIKTIPVIKRIFNECKDEECMINAGLCLTYITKNINNTDMNTFFNYDLIDNKWLKLISNNNINEPIIRTCGNIISGSDDATQRILDLGFLSHINLIYNISNTKTKELCWIISNITAGTVKQIQMVIEAGLFPPIFFLMKSGKWMIKKECIYIMSNLVSGGNRKQIDYAVECGVIHGLCDMLGCQDITMLIIILKTIHFILKYGKKVRKYDYYCDLVEEEGLDHIEQLQNHCNEKVYKISIKIIERHFSDNRTDGQFDNIDNTDGWNQPSNNNMDTDNNTDGWNQPRTDGQPDHTDGWNQPSNNNMDRYGWNQPSNNNMDTDGWNQPGTDGQPDHTDRWNQPSNNGQPDHTDGWTQPGDQIFSF